MFHIAIFLAPNSAKLQIALSTTLGFQEEVFTPSLPLNASTSVRIEAVGRDVFVLFNNSLVAFMTTQGDRIAAQNATLLVSDPWYPPAPATISGFSMTAITALSSRPLAQFNGVVSLGSAYEKTFVPQDYALSFNFTPLSTSFGIPQGVIQYSYVTSGAFLGVLC